MRDYIELGSAPSDEDCVQVNPSVDYYPLMQEECQRFLALIRQTMGVEPDGARLALKSFAHDFGTYIEVVCHFDTENSRSMQYAFECEANLPRTWES